MNAAQQEQVGHLHPFGMSNHFAALSDHNCQVAGSAGDGATPVPAGPCRSGAACAGAVSHVPLVLDVAAALLPPSTSLLRSVPQSFFHRALLRITITAGLLLVRWVLTGRARLIASFAFSNDFLVTKQSGCKRGDL